MTAIADIRGKASRLTKGGYQRNWRSITGVMLHSTGGVLGESEERWGRGISAHCGITRRGKLILIHPWETMIWHGHAPSRWTIGIEIDGNPEGKPGYHWKPGGGPHSVTESQVRACEVLLHLLTTEFAARGQRIEQVLAHRQSSGQRECDPGWQVWRRIGLPWLDILGATCGPDGPSSTWGTGLPIPREWDPASPHPWR